VRPEWIKLASGEAIPRTCRVHGTVVDVVYLGSVTQLIVVLGTGERLTVHQLNDRLGAEDPRPGERVTLHWAAEHTYVIGSAGSPADGADPHGADTQDDTAETAVTG
jgi:hypothetical protein